MQHDSKSARISLRIDNLDAALEQGIDNESGALDVLVAAVAKGNLHPELWARLHEATARHDRFSEMAGAYERLCGERRFTMLPPAVQAEVLVHGATFLADLFGDPVAARGYLERAIAAAPGHPEAFVRLERALYDDREALKLADLYAVSASHRAERAEQLVLFRRAVEILDGLPNEEERAIKLLQQILRIEPGDAAARWALEARFTRAGRLPDVARMLEQALTGEAPPPDAYEIRVRLVDLYSGPLREVERALPHVEEVLARNPAHEPAFRVAEALLARKTVTVRAAAALEGAYDRLGRAPDAARMMTLQIENLRGPRRTDVQKRLVELLFSKIGDAAAAFSLSEQILAVDPSDDLVRERYLALAASLDKRPDATRVLGRALTSAKDKLLRSRIASEMGELFTDLGDPRKARAAFQQVLDGEADELAVLRASRGLVTLCERERDGRGLAAALLRLIQVEHDPEARESAAERLARLCEEELQDTAGAIAAYRAVAGSGSAREPAALAALERLYEASGAHADLAWVLERRAEVEPDRRVARELAFRGAELRSTRLTDWPAAIASWRRAIAAFGASREALARLLPLLEQERRWAELAQALEAEAALAGDAGAPERAAVLARLGAIRMARLEDPAGAIAAYREALAIDPTDRASRLAVEKMLGARERLEHGAEATSSRQSAHLLLTDEQRLAACAVLEPVARAEGATALLLRVLETRAELVDGTSWGAGASGPASTEALGRLAALEEAVGLAERELRDPKKALDLAARALGLATSAAPERLARWVAEVERLTDPSGSESARRAPVLARAIGDHAVDSTALSHLARRAGEALLASGDATGALGLYRRALAFEPSSSELIARVDALLREQGSPEERITLYREALAQPCAPARRRELLHAIGNIQRRDLGDLPGAASTYRAAIQDDPGDGAAYEALLETYAAAGEWDALYDALDERLPRVAEADLVAHELRMAEVAAKGGRAPSALEHYRAILGRGVPLADAALSAMEALARAEADIELLREVFARRVASAVDPQDEAVWLERLGDLAAFGLGGAGGATAPVHGDVDDADDTATQDDASDAPTQSDTGGTAAHGDPAAAVAAWQRAASLAEGTLADPERAQQLYERVLGVAPGHREAAARLVSLYRGQGAWDRLPAVCEVLLDGAPSDEDALAELAILEDAATRVRATERFAAAAARLDQRIQGSGAAARVVADRRAAVDAALARVLAANPARQDDAAAVYRRMLAPPAAPGGAGAPSDALPDAAPDAGEATAAREAFRAFLSASPDTPARREDRRWLFSLLAERAHESERARALSVWAAWEEELGDRTAAAALYARLIETDPDNDVALAARGRLLLDVGDYEGAALVLATRRDRSEGGARAALEVELAVLLFERLNRPAEALAAIAPVLEAGALDPAVLSLAERALARPETQERAAELIERACDAAGDAEARIAILEMLLSSAAQSSDLDGDAGGAASGGGAPGGALEELAASVRAAARGRWFARLLEHLEEDPERGLDVALRAVAELPGELDLWDRVEQLERRLKQPERVAAAYAAAIERAGARSQAGVPQVAPEIIEELGRRAVEHHEEWFDAPEATVELLRRLVEIVPGSSWGFERLKLAYNAAERWSDLFALYDAMLERTSDKQERVFLLEDAAGVARDLAGDGERTMHYLEALLPLQDDARTRAQLERLYERHGKHRPLIELLRAELPRIAAEAAQRLRERIALLWIEGVGEAASALPVAEQMLDAEPASVAAFGLLERILVALPSDRGADVEPDAADAADVERAAARQRSAVLLAKRYRADARPEDLVRVLEIQLEAATGDARPPLLHEVVRLRRDALADEPGAFERLAELVELQPAPAADREELAELAERLGRYDRLAEVLAAAESNAEDAPHALALLREAATIRRDRLRDADGAIALFQRLFALAERQRDAASALFAARALDRLFAEGDRIAERCDVLDTLATLDKDPAARREALGELARLAASVLRDDARAIAAYSARLSDDRADLEALDGLAAILDQGGRFRELTEVLDRRAAVRGGADARRDLGRVARLFERELGDPEQAIKTWRRVRDELEADPESGDALAALYTQTERWDELVALLEVEAAAAATAADAARSAELFRRLGDVHRDRTLSWELAVRGYLRAHEAEQAGGAVASAAARAGLEELLVRVDPSSAEHRGALIALVDALLTICAATDDWAGQVALLEPRLAAAATEADRVRILHVSSALLEERGGDVGGAFDLAWRAFLLAAGSEDPAGLIRLADLAGRWQTVAAALVELEARGDVPPATLRDLWRRVGAWHRDARDDHAAAEGSYEQALTHDPSNSAILLDLAELQRRTRGLALVGTLLRLAAATGDDLRLYREAVEIARDGASLEPSARTIAEGLLDLAVRRWEEEETRAAEEAAEADAEPLPARPGGWAPAAAAIWAIDALIAMLAAAEEQAGIVALCRRGAALAFAPAEQRRLKRTAAEAAGIDEAIALYDELFGEDPTDEPVGESLAALLRSAERRGELVRLRERQIEVCPDLERRVALRYDAALLLAEIGHGLAAIEMLRQSLAESPGHAASTDKLASLLETGGLHRDLVRLREEQASAREAAKDGSAAAELWLQAASLAERELSDTDRAISSYRRAADIGSIEALDALARLLTSRGEHVAAAEALERLCRDAPPERLHADTLRLADAYLSAGQPVLARACLERALPMAAHTAPLRERLAYLYREAGAWVALAELIAGDAARAEDAAVRLSLLREAAELYLTRGNAPAAAIPLLDEAISLSPEDLPLRLARCRGLSAAGRYEDAASSLAAIIADFGSRRPKERALVHFELARVALLTGDRARAMTEFDLALRIDPAHPDALHGLAGLAFEDGQLDRANRAYRALLLVVRRPRDEEVPFSAGRSVPPGRSAAPGRAGAPRAYASGASFSRAEVLLALGEIARRQEAPEREVEYVESAFEAARESEVEQRHLLVALRARGRHDLLARALEAQLVTAPDNAAVLDELATLYAGALSRPEAALEARLRALELDPDATEAAHDAALELSRRMDQLDKYVELLDRLSAGAGEAPRAVGLLLRLGRALELSPGNDARAAAAYRSAESRMAAAAPDGAGVEEAGGADAGPALKALWGSLEALYDRVGDRAAQAEVLQKRIDAADVLPAPAADRADPRYRLAALLAADPAANERAIALLEQALELHADPERAEAILRDALGVDPKNHRAIRLFERLARDAGHPRALVDALVLLAAVDGPSALEEAVRLARSIGDRELAGSILRSVVGDGAGAAAAAAEPSGAAWALVALAELGEEAGDLAAAAELRERAARASAPDEERGLLLSVAALAAGPLADLPRAARLYEELRHREPAEREIWAPLAEVHRRAGDAVRLGALLEETVPLVDDVAERCALRLECARLLAREAPEKAAVLLRENLDEDPSQLDAAILLATMLEQAGRSKELGELFALQIDAAKDRGDAPSIVSLSMRLGALLEEGGDEPAARDVYLTAVDWDATNRDVLRAVVRLNRKRDDADDLIDSLERLLGVEQGDEAVELAVQLSQLQAARGDDAAAEAALQAGYAVCPTSDRLREELAGRYAAREAWQALAELYLLEAQARSTDEERVQCLCRAADVLRQRAGDAAAAAGILERALRIAPADREVLTALIEACGAIGDHARAAQALSATIATIPGDPWLHRARAAEHEALGQGDQALADLEQAHALGGAGYAGELVAQLERALARADAAAPAAPRGLRLRLAEILAGAGDVDRARHHLGELVRVDVDDREALRALAGLEASAERWDAASAAYQRLIEVEAGAGDVAALVATALRLADACARAGRLGDARGGLERALGVAPTNIEIRDRLRSLYAASGASRELAAITLEDAAAAPDVAGRFALLVLAGRLLIDAGDAEPAIPVLAEARALRPDEQDVVLLLIDAFTASDRRPEARALVTELITAQKGRRSKMLGAVYHRLARLEGAEGNPRESLAALSKAFESDALNGALAMELADYAQNLGEQEISARAYRAVTLMKIAPEPGADGTTQYARAVAYYHLGAMAFAAGDRRKAKLMLDKSVSEDGSLEATRALLDELRAG